MTASLSPWVISGHGRTAPSGTVGGPPKRASSCWPVLIMSTPFLTRLCGHLIAVAVPVRVAPLDRCFALVKRLLQPAKGSLGRFAAVLDLLLGRNPLAGRVIEDRGAPASPHWLQTDLTG